MLAEQMRESNRYHAMLRPDDWNRPFAEQDIRFAEFIDWLNTQEQQLQDVVTLAMHFGTAYAAKFSPLEHPPIDDEVLERVEEVQKRLGVDFLYT